MFAQSVTLKADGLGDNVKDTHPLLLFLNRMTVQLAAGFLIGIAVPVALRHYGVLVPETSSSEILQYRNSILGTFAAMLFGFVILRKTTALPGAEALMNVLPAFLISYGVVLVVFMALRLGFSRYIFGVSFILTVGWFYLAILSLLRLHVPHFGVVPGGCADEIFDTPGIKASPVTSIEDADRVSPMPLTVDFRAESLTDEWERYLAEQAIQGRSIYNTSHLVETLEGKVHLRHMTGHGIGQLAHDVIYEPAKRYIDAVAAIVALVMLSPILGVVAFLICIDSPGPALFKQKRMGFRGQPFTVVKFRSMVVGDDTAAQARANDMTQTDDRRITRVGRVIRKLRIDELPQLLNVARGEMSWIGPRPETLQLSEWYEREIPFYRLRHSVRPGITGWAQVRQGHVTSVEDVREKLEYDLFYVKHFSLWFDVAIVVHTVRVMLTGRGAR